MKSDSSRFTFDPRKHFSGVRMQQGRVQLDADSNEQTDIVNHRVNTEASDVIGLCGAPMHNAGFQIQAQRKEMIEERAEAEERNEDVSSSGAERAAAPAAAAPEGLDFLISAGRYYVDGILCQNEQPVSYLNQDTLADLPGPPPLGKGIYIVYLDVWERLLTALDDPLIREIALGGPDTAARAKTIWQVRCWQAIDEKGNPLDNVNCLTRLPGFDRLIAPSSVQLAARTRREEPTTDACMVSPGAGFTGLENQLYRIEIHDGGQGVDISEGDTFAASRVPGAKNQIVVSGTWKRGQAIEIFSSKPGDNPMSGTLAHIIKVDSGPLEKPQPVSKKAGKAAVDGIALARKGRQTLTLDIDVSTLPELSVRLVDATFKWSRDNAVVVTPVETITGQKITVHDLGPDDTLGFKEGQWVELIDDTLELQGKPGELGQITNIDSAIKEITLSFGPTLTINSDPNGPARHLRLRRWEGVEPVKYNAKTPGDSFIDLESGVQVQFSEGQVRTGDYWTIPARTATADTQSGNIEWPQDADKNPLSQLPFGIKHHYCRLAVVQCSSRIEEIQDCRKIFPPITELTSFRYVGGDGQEAMPGDPQPQPLRVGVFNGSWPVPGAPVSFATSEGGELTPDIADLPKSMPRGKNKITVLTDANGVASCGWTLDRKGRPSQQVDAQLLDANGDFTASIVKFNGNHSIAAQVFYDPGDCGTLRGQGNVQQALSTLSQLNSLYKISGDGQEIMPGEKVKPLKVLVASPCGPVTDERFLVTFSIVQPEKGERDITGKGEREKGTNEGVIVAAGGKPGKSSSGGRGRDGFWTCSWEPDETMPFQEVEASIEGDATTPPKTVRFSLNLSKADHVRYSPGECGLLKASDTVQKAIDQLALATSLYEVSGNDQEVMSGSKSPLELKVLAANKCGPVKEQRISFKVLSGDGKVEPAEVVTKEDGMATALWTMGRKDPNQQVEANLVDSKVPIALPSSVLFNAHLSQTGNVSAGNVSYDPDPQACPDLANAKVTTVQAALDALCQRKPPENQGIQIKEIKTTGSPKNPSQTLLNDTLVPVVRFADGVTIICDKPIAPAIGFGSPDPKITFPLVAPKPTCFVTLDFPGGIQFQPMILACNVEVKDKEIRWALTAAARSWLTGTVFGPNVALYRTTDRVLAHLTLKGKFVVSSGPEPEMWLDGEAFAFRSKQGDVLDLRFPDGHGRKGGDFEMWFYLFPGLILQVDAGTNIIVGTVLDASGKGVSGAAVTATPTVQITPPTPTATTKTDGRGNFQFPKTAKGVYKVNATLGEELWGDREVIVP